MRERARREKIISLLEDASFLSNGQLIDILKVSEATIRRDLKKLSGEGMIKRVRGGAEAIDDHARTNPPWKPFDIDQVSNIELKRKIAQKAAEFCEPGESIIIDGGTTTNMMVEFLANIDLQVLTNALHTAIDLIKNTDAKVIVPGGEIFRQQKVIVSPFENDTIQQYSASKLFMGIRGISSIGLTQWDPLLIRAQEKLMNQAEKIIVMADHTKFQNRDSFILCPLHKIDCIITNDQVDAESIKMIENEGVELIIV